MVQETDQNEERGFRQIGSLMPSAEKSRGQKDSQSIKSTDSENVSTTTGSRVPAPAQPNSIGRPLGGTISVQTLPENKLADLHPVQADRAIKERLPLHVACLISTAEILNDDFEVVGYKPLDLDPSEALAVLENTDEFFLPAPYEMILKGLARARAMTKRRTEQADDEEITLAAYAELFIPWPADVTAMVLSRMHKLDGGWWPSAAAVERELKTFGGGRMELRKALTAVR